IFDDTPSAYVYTLSYTTLFRSRREHLSGPELSLRHRRRPRAPVPARAPSDAGVSGVGGQGVALQVRPRRGLLSHPALRADAPFRSEEHTSELQSRSDIVCRLLL